MGLSSLIDDFQADSAGDVVAVTGRVPPVCVWDKFPRTMVGVAPLEITSVPLALTVKLGVLTALVTA
jgi:hypothetical protein